jgi:predicted nuclease of predicted toxin-antitoxin system
MKFLLDQDVYALTERFLREQGYDVATASELGLSHAQDSDLLKTAGEQGRTFVTRDRDYGNLVFVLGLGSGVIYLRILPSDMDEVHAELKRYLKHTAKTSWQNRLSWWKRVVTESERSSNFPARFHKKTG